MTVLSQTFGRSQNISSEIDDSECERRGDSVYVEEPDEGEDGVTPRMGRVPAPCFLGCKSSPVISSGKNLQRKLKLLQFGPLRDPWGREPRRGAENS